MICSECENGNHDMCHDIRVDTIYPPRPVIFKPGPESGYYNKEHPNEWRCVPTNISSEKIKCPCASNYHGRYGKPKSWYNEI